MKILSIRSASPGGGNVRARVDVEMPAGIRLFNIAIKETPQGWRAYAPSAFGGATATFTPEVAAQIVAAARSAMGEIRHHDRTAA